MLTPSDGKETHRIPSGQKRLHVGAARGAAGAVGAVAAKTASVEIMASVNDFMVDLYLIMKDGF